MASGQAGQYRDKRAVVCGRGRKGTVVTGAELEEPAIFPELEESGLITSTPETLTVGEVIGATLIKDVDGLTSLTADMFEGLKAKAAAPAAAAAPAVTMAGPSAPAAGGFAGFRHHHADSVTGLAPTIPPGGHAGSPITHN